MVSSWARDRVTCNFITDRFTGDWGGGFSLNGRVYFCAPRSDRMRLRPSVIRLSATGLVLIEAEDQEISLRRLRSSAVQPAWSSMLFSVLRRNESLLL